MPEDMSGDEEEEFKAPHAFQRIRDEVSQRPTTPLAERQKMLATMGKGLADIASLAVATASPLTDEATTPLDEALKEIPAFAPTPSEEAPPKEEEKKEEEPTHTKGREESLLGTDADDLIATMQAFTKQMSVDN